MKNTLLAALAAVCLCASSGCCRCWFKWPGQYEHNPSFSQCCETPWKWGNDKFAGRGMRPGRPWGNGAVQGECHYDGRLGGLFPLFKKHRGQECAEDCGCGDEPGYGPGYPRGGHAGPGGQPYPGMPGMPPMGYPGMSPMGYGPGGPGMMGGVPISPEGIPLQPAPDAMSAAQVAYPYYTTRGPRDFLLGSPPGTQPPSIGP